MRYSQFAAVTEHDTNLLPFLTDALYIGTSGSVVVEDQDGKEVTFSSVPVGILPIVARKLKTASTAAAVVALKA